MGLHGATPQQYEQVREIFDIRPGEPIFIIRAQDRASVPTIEDYILNSESEASPREHLEGVVKHVEEFRNWQSENPQLLKVPGTPYEAQETEIVGGSN